MKPGTAILILAAGRSARLGSPKQLFVVGENTLLQNAIQAALTATPHVFVVVGAFKEEIMLSLGHLPIRIIQNTEWQKGMGGSVRVGVAYILETMKEVDYIVLSVCDQPNLSGRVFQKLMEKKRVSTKGIIASAYAYTIGVPVLFSKTYFGALLNSQADKGAKPLLMQNVEDIGSVEFLGGEWDIDSAEDLKREG